MANHDYRTKIERGDDPLIVGTARNKKINTHYLLSIDEKDEIGNESDKALQEFREIQNRKPYEKIFFVSEEVLCQLGEQSGFHAMGGYKR